jgi:hypothetical protein
LQKRICAGNDRVPKGFKNKNPEAYLSTAATGNTVQIYKIIFLLLNVLGKRIG